MLGVRLLLLLGSKMLALLLPQLVVCPLINLSPPVMRTFPLCGRTIWALQNRSVPVVLSRVKWEREPSSGDAVGGDPRCRR